MTRKAWIEAASIGQAVAGSYEPRCTTVPPTLASSTARCSALSLPPVSITTSYPLLALLALTAAEEALDRDGGAVLQNPGELMACDLCAAPSQVLQVRGADPRRHDAYKFPYTLRLVDIDDLNRGRGVAHCLHQMFSPD